MIESVSRWLRDGDDHTAADLVDQCDIEPHFIDLFFEIGGGRDYEVYDLVVAAPRPVHIALESNSELSNLIETAIRGCAESEGMQVRGINWIPRTVSASDDLDRELGLTLKSFDAEHVSRFWRKCLDRKSSDPDGAITAARSMLESVCKHILNSRSILFDYTSNLPSLFHATLDCLSLSPRQQTDDTLRRLLGNCQSIVNGLASIRNDIGDAHGKVDGELTASALEAELAVNLAASVAMFVLQQSSVATSPAASCGT